MQLTIPAQRGALEAALTGLVALNRYYMRRRKIPPLYESGVVYKAEPKRRPEKWRTADAVYTDGEGDCEDLASYRVAELQVLGEPARARVVRTGKRRFHAIVERADGSTEDPSRILKRKW
jgi:hypothetical protein